VSRFTTVTAPGDVLDGVYRVDEVAADHIGLTYLPLNAKQTLSFGAGAAPGAPPPPGQVPVPIATRDVISMAPAIQLLPICAHARDSSPVAAGADGIQA